jgi:predicted nucleic acid-binding protein
MDSPVVIDTCVFVKHWRSKNKTDTLLTKLLHTRKVYVSAVAKYEVLAGANEKDLEEWHQVFEDIAVLAFDEATIESARMIFRQLKQENKIISLGDILIAATAMVNDLPLATLNRNHFERIRGLRMV